MPSLPLMPITRRGDVWYRIGHSPIALRLGRARLVVLGRGGALMHRAELVFRLPLKPLVGTADCEPTVSPP